MPATWSPSSTPSCRRSAITSASRSARSNIFGPTRVVIGGGFGIGAFDLLVPAARTAVLREALAPGGQTLEIARAELGAEAGLIGAGLIAHESLR